MGATYTRQSTYADGDTINAADSNDEFDQLLAAFASSTGHTHDGTAGEGGPISSLISNTITFGTGADTDVAVTFDGNTSDGVLTWMEDEDYFQFSDDILMSTTEKLQFRDTAIYINSSADGQLDLVADTEIQIAATTIDVNGNLDVSGTVVGASTISAGTAFVPDASDGAALGTTSLEFSDLFLADAAVINLGADQDVTLTHVADTGVLLNAASVIQFRDSAINIGSPADGDLDINADDEIELNSTLIDINGNVDVSGTSTLTGNVTLGGQLIMPTVTSGHILVADGTSFEEKAVGDLAEIATVANDDVFLAVDTSGGGLKKITRSAVVAGLATSSAISNVSEDSTPQLGGNLDMNGADIVTTSNATIDLAPNGTGTVVVRGNTNPGTVVFNCESNSHGQTVKSQPHSASVTNVLTLPPGGDQEIVGTTATQTLTNKTIGASQLSGTVANARLDAQLQDVAGLAVTDSGFIVGDGSNFVLETGATVRTSLGLGTAAVLDTGIANTNVPKFTTGVADDDFLRVAGTSIEGRSAAEVRTDIGATTIGAAVFTAANVAAAQQAQDLEVGVDVQAFDANTKKAGKETMWIPAVSMYPNTTNGCAAIAQTELSNGPEIKTLDFDKDSDEFAQFSIAFPKSWNEGTVTFQAFFTANSTNTGTTVFVLNAVALADNGDLNTAFGTAVGPTAKAMSGTANDLAVTAESGAVTIAGSPSTDEYVFFQISRDVSEDSLAADAKLLGIKLFFTTDAANDA
jgi:hypothetical protein